MNVYSAIQRPTLLLHEDQAKRNIARMAAKAAKSGVRFRPHFKTHQSAAIGEWFREQGVEAITVSSADMAIYFARNGWTDITIAFPAYEPQVDLLSELAGHIRLNIVVESVDAANSLGRAIQDEVAVWIKVDAGYGRTGIAWNNRRLLAEVARAVEATGRLRVTGLLCHAGNTYGAGSTDRILEIFAETANRMNSARDALREEGWDLEISVGDTPGCSLAPSFRRVDEVRPGNFVFYDLAQHSFGACTEYEIAVALACPVVAKHASRSQIVIHGGAVHLSLDRLVDENGRVSFGGVAMPTQAGWSRMFANSYVRSLSQEHGILQAEPELFDEVKVGDLLVVIPIHSCLTANLMGSYLTLDGDYIAMASD